MDESNVAHIERVLEILVVIAFAQVGVDLDQPVEVLEFGIGREVWGHARPEISEDEAEILAHRIRIQPDAIAIA